MGLDDEAEKLRQAADWLREGCPTIHRQAAMEYIIDRLHNTTRDDIRNRAFYLLQEANAPNGDA